jgi:hypothetical protein
MIQKIINGVIVRYMVMMNEYQKNIDAILVVVALLSILIPSAALIVTSSSMFYAFVGISGFLVGLIVFAGFLSILVSGVYFIYKTFSNFEEFRLRVLSAIFRRTFLLMFIFESVSYTLRMVGNIISV